MKPITTLQHADPPALVPETDAARYISMSVSYLRQARMEGQRQGRTAGPPWIQVGRAVRYSIPDLDAWIARNRRQVA